MYKLALFSNFVFATKTELWFRKKSYGGDNEFDYTDFIPFQLSMLNPNIKPISIINQAMDVMCT